MKNANTWVACAVGALLFLASSALEAQVGGPPAGVRGCTDTGQPRAALLGWANSLRFRSLDHNGGGHAANLTIDDSLGKRIGPAATVQPVDSVDRMTRLSRPGGRAGTIVAMVYVDTTFTDPLTGQKGFAPRGLPPGQSFIMICEETTGPTTTYTALIIPTDGAWPLTSRPVDYYDIGDGLNTARARFQAGSSEVICVSCKLNGWCEVQ